jgi:hypothetical protein
MKKKRHKWRDRPSVLGDSQTAPALAGREGKERGEGKKWKRGMGVIKHKSLGVPRRFEFDRWYCYGNGPLFLLR